MVLKLVFFLSDLLSLNCFRCFSLEILETWGKGVVGVVACLTLGSSLSYLLSDCWRFIFIC